MLVDIASAVAILKPSIYVDHGLTAPIALGQGCAMPRAACQSGDTLVVTTDWRGSVAPRPFCSRNNASAAAYDFEYGARPWRTGGRPTQWGSDRSASG
jgi:hypothetical protein